MNFNYYPNNIIEMDFSLWFIFIVLISIILFSYVMILYKEYCSERMTKLVTKYGVMDVKYSTKVFKWNRLKFVFSDDAFYNDGRMFLMYFANNKITK